MSRTSRGWVGPVRVVLVTLAGAGLVLGAGRVTDVVDLPASMGGSAQSATTPATAGSTRAVTTSGLTCPGPETAGLAAVPAVSGTTSVLAATAPASALGGVSPSGATGTLTVTGQPSAQRLGAASARGASVDGSVSGAVSAQVTATGALAPAVAAIQTWTHIDGDAQALVSTPCLAPRADIWLVGGGGQSTRRERIVLANPGANTVTADLAVLGAKGPVAVAGGSDVTVPARGRTSLLLDALVGAETTPVVHITTSGGLLTAVLEDSWVDNAVGRGADDATPTAAPATEQVLPAVAVNGAATLRVAVPGTQEAVVQTRALTASGPRPLPTGGVLRVAGQTSVDVDLTALPTGAYAIQVRSDQPVVAGAMVQRRPAGVPQSDFAWTTASSPVEIVAGTPLPSGLNGQLSVAATDGAAAVTVTTVSATGAVTSTPMSVAADSIAVMAVQGPGQVWVTRTSGTVRAGLSLSAATNKTGPLFTAFALEPAAVSGTQVPVSPLP